uniref:Uncharacterized protein n=1 Tax=Quercus lobata TaxID=97700 RepID=A0A7N2L332_QUELO
MLLHLEVAGKALYVLVLVVFLLLYLGEWKRNRRGGRHVQTTGRANFVGGDGDNGGETISGQIASEVHAIVDDTMGGQFAGEVRFDVAGDDDDLRSVRVKRVSVKPWLWSVSILSLLASNYYKIGYKSDCFAYSAACLMSISIFEYSDPIKDLRILNLMVLICQ